MILNELCCQFCTYPLLRITVFLIFLSLLIEIFVFYIYSWVKADIEAEITNLRVSKESVDLSLLNERECEKKLIEQRQKITDMEKDLFFWKQQIREKNLESESFAQKNTERLVKKKEIVIKNLDLIKNKQFMALSCLRELEIKRNNKTENERFFLDLFLNTLKR